MHTVIRVEVFNRKFNNVTDIREICKMFVKKNIQPLCGLGVYYSQDNTTHFFVDLYVVRGSGIPTLDNCYILPVNDEARNLMLGSVNSWKETYISDNPLYTHIARQCSFYGEDDPMSCICRDDYEEEVSYDKLYL